MTQSNEILIAGKQTSLQKLQKCHKKKKMEEQ